MHYHDKLGTDQSVEQAKAMLKANGVDLADTKNRLMIPMLYNFDWDMADEVPALKCSLRTLERHLMPNTPTDNFLFVPPQVADAHDKYPQFVNDALNTYVIAIPPTVWKFPNYTRKEIASWTSWSLGFSHDYRKMGHFRLAFQFFFARDLGYKYLFQFDSDSYVNQPVKMNLVQHLREKDYWMTNKPFFFYEVQGYQVGLAEITRYWIATRKGLKWQPPGELFEHCKPQNLDGLHTNPEPCWWGFPNSTGWDGYMIAGNFNTFSIDFWFQEHVQDFIHLIVRSNGHIEQRWVDVSPQSMVWQMFVPKEKFHIWKDEEIVSGHGRPRLGVKFTGTICEDIPLSGL